jgi:multiple sugar transport system permease protein
MATVWEFIFHPNIGLANAVLGSFGVGPVRFLGSPDNALFSLCAIGVWELVGFNMVLFLAGISGIPRELNEAASIDGADGSIDRFLTVTWPMLGPTTLFVVVITAVRAFRVFETVAVLTQGGPDKATEVLLYTMYLEGFQYFRIGYASALTVVFLSFTVILILAQVRIAERRIHYS